MAEIINATTPTLQFTFETVNTETIVVANLYVKALNNAPLIQRDITSATIEEKKISWKLTQTETLKLPIDKSIIVVMDWRLADGTRGRSKVGQYLVRAPGKGEII